MNCNPNGSRLTVEDLVAIAANTGPLDEPAIRDRIASLHNEGLVRSWLTSITAKARLSMFWAGELVLDSNPEVSAPKSGDADPEVLAYFTSITVRSAA